MTVSFKFICINLFLLPSLSALRVNTYNQLDSANTTETQQESLVHAPKEEPHVPGYGAPVVWQRPKGEVKGILLYIPGCGGRATDTFTVDGHDGHHLNMCEMKNGCADGEKWSWGCCPGREEEVMARQKARKRGYLFAVVQPGHNHGNRCPYMGDMTRILKSLEYVKLREKVENKPVIVAGFSAGGGFAPIVSTYVRSNCTVMAGAAARVEGTRAEKLGFPKGYPANAPVFFIHNKENLTGTERKDKSTLTRYVEENMMELKERKIANADIQTDSAKGHYNYLGVYMDEALDFCETQKAPSTDNTKPSFGLGSFIQTHSSESQVAESSMWSLWNNFQREFQLQESEISMDISAEELMSKRAEELQKPATWTPPSCPSTRKKWVYIRGDSTMRQVVQRFLVSLSVKMDDEQLKSFVRQKCGKPPHSADYYWFMQSHPEYGNLPCYRNERRCAWNMDKTRITYDWQHFVLEEREKFLFNKSALADENHDFHDGLPDLLVMGLPLHLCSHTNPNLEAPGYVKFNRGAGSQKNQKAEDMYKSEISQLFSSVRSVYKGPVVWVEAGGVTTYEDKESKEYMRCLTNVNQELNRAVKADAGSRVVPRQEIELNFMKTHPNDQKLHKPTKCVSDVYESICSNFNELIQ